MPEDSRSAVVVSLYKGNEERIKCRNYRGIRMFSVVGKIYAGILVDRVRRVIESLIDDEERGFRAGR